MTLIFKYFNKSVPNFDGFVAWYDIYNKIASSNTSRLEAHVGFFRLLTKGIFGPYVL